MQDVIGTKLSLIKWNQITLLSTMIFLCHNSLVSLFSMDFFQSFRILPAEQLSAFVILSLLWPVHGPENFVEMF